MLISSFFISEALRYGPCLTVGSLSFTCHPHMNHTCLCCLCDRCWQEQLTFSNNCSIRIQQLVLHQPDTEDAKLYATYRCCQRTKLRCRQMSYGDDRQRNTSCRAASVDIRRRSVCERCRWNQRARLQRCRTSTYGERGLNLAFLALRA